MPPVEEGFSFGVDLVERGDEVDSGRKFVLDRECARGLVVVDGDNGLLWFACGDFGAVRRRG